MVDDRVPSTLFKSGICVEVWVVEKIIYPELDVQNLLLASAHSTHHCDVHVCCGQSRDQREFGWIVAPRTTRHLTTEV